MAAERPRRSGTARHRQEPAPGAFAPMYQSMEVPWQSHRPRRSGAARQLQQLRSDTRVIQRIIRGVDELRAHRGGQPSRLGQALAEALQLPIQRPPVFAAAASPVCRPSKLCRHFAAGHCRRGETCGFRHDAASDSVRPDAASGSIVVEESEPNSCGLDDSHADDNSSTSPAATTQATGSRNVDPTRAEMDSYCSTNRSVLHMRADAPTFVPASEDLAGEEGRPARIVPRDAITGTAMVSACQGSPVRHAVRGRSGTPVPSHCSESHESDIHSDTDNEATIHAHDQQGHDMAASSQSLGIWKQMREKL